MKKGGYILLLLVIIIISYWQVSFLVYSLKWDLIDVVFPFRFYFSESIQSGYFPFWNPYQQTGTPFFADLQVPFFYPELLFTSLFTGYGIYVMHFLFVLYAAIAALGMYQLSFQFNQNRLASLLAGIAYALSGFFIGHGQHLFLLIGAAWIPFVLSNYLLLQEKRNFVQVLKTAAFVFLMVTGSYQALSFTLFYLLILLFIYFIGKALWKRDIRAITANLKVNILLLLVVLVLLLPLIVSTVEVLNSVDRLETGVDLDQTLHSGQTLKSVLSFVIPFATLKYAEFFGNADMSMTNHYFGLIPLLFFVAALLKKRSVLEYIFLFFGLVIFASAFLFLPFRELLYRYIPFMNLFKYAAYIRVFGILAFILLAANYFSQFQKNFDNEKNKLLALGGVLLIALLFLIGYSITKVTFDDFHLLFNGNGLTELLNKMSFYQHILIQGVFQVFVVSAFLAILLFHKKLQHPFHFILIVLFVEMFAAAQLNVAHTVVGTEFKPQRMKKDLALFPKKFPIPVNDKIIYNDQMHAFFPPLWRNTYIFSKQIAFDSFSSFELKSYSKLDDDFPNLKNAVLNNHLLYFSDTVLPLSQFADSSIDVEKSHMLLYLSDEDYSLLSQKKTASDSADNIKITAFSPNEIIVQTNSRNDQFLTLLQSNFNGWTATIDNSETPIYTSNFNYQTVFLPKGKHTVRFQYRNDKILVLYIVSNVPFFLIVLFLIGYSLRKRKSKGHAYLFLPLAILLITGFFLVKRLSYHDKNLSAHQIQAERWKDKTAAFTFQQDFEDYLSTSDTTMASSGNKNALLTADMEYFTLVNIDSVARKLKEGTLAVRLKVYAETYPEALLVSSVSGEKPKDAWHATKIEKQFERLNQWNEIAYYRNFQDLKEGEVINVFIWNLKGKTFRIDDVRVDFYAY